MSNSVWTITGIDGRGRRISYSEESPEDDPLDRNYLIQRLVIEARKVRWDVLHHGKPGATPEYHLAELGYRVEDIDEYKAD